MDTLSSIASVIVIVVFVFLLLIETPDRYKDLFNKEDDE